MSHPAATSVHPPGDSRLPDDASSKHASVTCGKCSQQNPSERRFCGGCGVSLWEKCPQCGVEHADNEVFCGACGVNLQQVHDTELQRLQTTLDESQTLAANHEYDHAIRRLHSVATIENRRFQQLADQAKRIIDRIEKERDHSLLTATKSLKQARDLMLVHAYDTAARELASIPKPLRDAETESLLSESRRKHETVATLNAQIREAVHSNDLHGLSARLEHLLDLKPDDEQAKRLAHQLRDRFFQAAKKKVQEEDYKAAIRYLDDIPNRELDEGVNTLADQLRELDWLMENLRLAAVVDDTLLALADRLTRLRPQNQEAARKYEKLKALSVAKPSNGTQAAPDWAVPRKPHLGVPVRWPAALRRIGCSEGVAKAFQAKPGSFFVACGLALQGLESASIATNLLAADRQTGVFGKLRLRRARSHQAAWGLDLGTHSLKAVRMQRVDDGERLVVDECLWIQHPSREQPQGDESSSAKLGRRSLEQFLTQHACDGERICVSLPGSLVLGRFFDLPPVEAKRMDDAVRYEATGQVPFALDELHWGYDTLELDDQGDADSGKWRVVMQAVKSHHVHDLVLLCQEAGLKPDIVQSDCAALHNLTVYEHFDGRKPQDGAVAVLDVGAGKSNLVISTPRSVWFRSIGVGGEAFTSSLVRNFQLTRKQAENLKINPCRAKRLSPVYDALDPSLTQLVHEVQRSLKVYAKLHPDLPVHRILGTGGGFAMHGLMRRLRTGR